MKQNQAFIIGTSILVSFLRGIETSFNHLKNAIHLEEFVGIKDNSIKQEFYATLINYNMFLLFVEEAKIANLHNKKNIKI